MITCSLVCVSLDIVLRHQAPIYLLGSQSHRVKDRLENLQMLRHLILYMKN